MQPSDPTEKISPDAKITTNIQPKPKVVDPVEKVAKEKPAKHEDDAVPRYTVGKKRSLTYFQAWDLIEKEPAAQRGDFSRLRLLNRQRARFSRFN